MNVRHVMEVFVSIASLAMASCAITSDGLELEHEDGGEPAVATFRSQSSNEVTGTMTTSLADGRLFTGPYFRIALETPVDQLAPLWEGWSSAVGWRHWQPGPRFVKQYSGKILASLVAANGDRMRCQFRLAQPSSGMVSGADGKCQLSDGMAVHASLPPLNDDSASARR
jgi:hypothetical protein